MVTVMSEGRPISTPCRIVMRFSPGRSIRAARNWAAHKAIVKALTEIDDFNAVLGSKFDDEDYHTVGGLILHHLGHVPKRQESIDIDGLRFQVLRADRRRLYTLSVRHLSDEEKTG